MNISNVDAKTFFKSTTNVSVCFRSLRNAGDFTLKCACATATATMMTPDPVTLMLLPILGDKRSLGGEAVPFYQIACKTL